MASKRAHDSASDDNPASPKSMCVDDKEREAAPEAKICVLCAEEVEELLRLPCCPQEICHGCLCSIYIKDREKCAFCRKAYASTTTAVLLVRSEKRCISCDTKTGFMLECSGENCAERDPPPQTNTFTTDTMTMTANNPLVGMAERAARVRTVRRHVIADIDMSMRVSRVAPLTPYMRILLHRDVMLGLGNGPTLPSKEFVLNTDGSMGYPDPDDGDVGRVKTWSYNAPKWFPIMSSTLALTRVSE